MQQSTSFFSLLFIWTIFTLSPNSADAQCPGCIIALPPLPADTIFLGAAPDGEVFTEYDGNISFRLPMTTTPVAAVDPDVPPGLTIEEFTITGVSGLPPGLDWEANQYVFDPAVETDGCVRICGTPVVADSFFVEVLLNVVVFGINNPFSFPVPVYIAPSTSTTDGFTMSNNTGCGETTVEFTNNIPSNGNPGYSYFWNFGNGNMSTAENPLPQTYNQPGTYVVEYQASVDTIGFILTEITVEDAGCDDIIGDPDFFVIISDPQGNEIYTSPTVADSPPPVSFGVNIPLTTGNYSLEVRDEELIGSASCGTVNFSQTTMGLLTDGDLEISLEIANPVSTVTSADTVYVYEIPAAPVIVAESGFNCADDPLDIVITDNNYPDNLQWYRDSVAIAGATTDTLTTSQNGIYWVEYTSPEGCFAQSNTVDLLFLPVPPAPEFTNIDNNLTITQIDSLPDNYTLSWFYEGTLEYTGPETEFCATQSGLYTLVVEDISTGCTNSFELTVEVDPDFDCTVAVSEAPGITPALAVYPNPFAERLWVELDPSLSEVVHLRLLTIDGREVWRGLAFPGEKAEISTAALPAGFYLLELRTADNRQTVKLIK